MAVRAQHTDGKPGNELLPEDRPAHDWYRFVLSFPPHLVRDYVQRFGLGERHRVLDPFCGTGTTLVECKKLRIPSVGIEANPVAHFATRVKVDWSPDPDGLVQHASIVAQAAEQALASEGIEDTPLVYQPHNGRLRRLPDEAGRVLLKDSISPLPLHKALLLIECLEHHRIEQYHSHELLVLARAVVFSASNLKFGPEVGLGPVKPDAPLLWPWREGVRIMGQDLRLLSRLADVPATVYRADSRAASQVLDPDSIDAVITSPPYPNEKDYTRTTRLESVLLGFVRNETDLKSIKHDLVRSNTRGVYVDDGDDSWVADHSEIQRIAAAIESRRLDLGKTSGFERLYHRVTRLYFGGMARHLADLRTVLRRGAYLAYVVGDQASYLRVMIRTGELLAGIARSLGYELVGIDLFRTRLATATREQLREEVVILRWPG